MHYLVLELMDFIGVGSPSFSSFSDLFIWFVTLIFGVEFVLFVIDGIFYTIRNVVRGIK